MCVCVLVCAERGWVRIRPNAEVVYSLQLTICRSSLSRDNDRQTQSALTAHHWCGALGVHACRCVWLTLSLHVRTCACGQWLIGFRVGATRHWGIPTNPSTHNDAGSSEYRHRRATRVSDNPLSRLSQLIKPGLSMNIKPLRQHASTTVTRM